jgi:hypothetical protein
MQIPEKQYRLGKVCVLYRYNVFSLSYGATPPWKAAQSGKLLCIRI